MPSRLNTRPFIVTAASAVAVFVAVLVFMAVQMADGRDPALGASAKHRAPAKASVTHAQAPVVPQPEVQQPTYDDGGGYSGYDDGSGGSYVAPAQPAPQPAPVQSGTS